jgi:hypothetical protein
VLGVWQVCFSAVQIVKGGKAVKIWGGWECG